MVISYLTYPFINIATLPGIWIHIPIFEIRRVLWLESNNELPVKTCQLLQFNVDCYFNYITFLIFYSQFPSNIGKIGTWKFCLKKKKLFKLEYPRNWRIYTYILLATTNLEQEYTSLKLIGNVNL